MLRAVVLLIAFAGALVAGRGTAHAETLVLVEVPARLEAALRTSLAPWGVEIVVVTPAPEPYDPDALVAAHDASFVVWRRGAELALYDAAAASEERRPLPHDLDDAEAAAAALSIKTWMGLGAPPGGVPVCGLHDCPPAAPPARRWLVEAMLGARGNVADTGSVGLRYGLGAGAREGRFEAGLRLELGGDLDGTAFRATGDWSELAAGGWVRAAFRVAPAITVLPGLGVGLVHTSFHAPRTAAGVRAEDGAATGFALDASVGARWQHGRVAAGAWAGMSVVPGDQVLTSRNLEAVVDAHVEPTFLATVSVGL